MDFKALVNTFTTAVVARDGTALANLFVEDGIYVDTFYGAFKGRPAIRDMLEVDFYKDAEDFGWKMVDPVSDGRVGYARWAYFSYVSTMPQSTGKRVIADGISFFQLENGLVRHYHEQFNTGVAFSQLGMTGSAMEKVYGKWNRRFLEQPEVASILNNWDKRARG